MRTVILLVALVLVKGQSPQEYYNEEGVYVSPNVPEQTIGVEVREEPQYQFVSLPNEVPANTANLEEYSTTVVTEPSTVRYEQSTVQPFSTEYYAPTTQTPPRPSNGNRRGSARFGATQQPFEPEITYNRQRTSRWQTTTPRYRVDERPTTTEHPRQRFPQRSPNSIQEEPASKVENEEKSSRRRGGRRNPDADAYIVRYSNENNLDRGYKFGYETSNKLMRNEELVFEDPENADQPTIYGGYEFVDPTGIKVIVTYTAGIHGFQPIIKYIKPETKI